MSFIAILMKFKILSDHSRPKKYKNYYSLFPYDISGLMLIIK